MAAVQQSLIMTLCSAEAALNPVNHSHGASSVCATHVCVCVLVCSWIEGDRDESEDYSTMKHAIDIQSQLPIRPPPKSDIFSFDISGSTTRNMVDFSISNKGFQSDFHSGELGAPPARKIAIVTCMDARMHPEAFLGLRFGDAHVIRNAGGRISDDALRSLVVSQRMLGTEEVVVIHHTECGKLIALWVALR